jgi:hypothetical protein
MAGKELINNIAESVDIRLVEPKVGKNQQQASSQSYSCVFSQVILRAGFIILAIR